MAATPDSRAFLHRVCGFGCLLVFVGVAGLAGLWVAKARVSQTAHWPSVPGRMVTSEVTTATVKTGRVLQISPVAKTVYAYAVNGKTYQCDLLRVLPMLHLDPEGTPEQIVARYPVGKPVTVYYDPQNPADAVLIPVPAEDARTLIGTLTLMAPVVAGVGLVIAGTAGVKLRRERGPVPTATATPAVVAIPVALPVPVLSRPAVLPRVPAPPRRTHWIVRAAATVFGLGLFLFGSLVTLTMTRITIPAASGAVHMAMLVTFGAVTLFGAYLICVGMRRARKSTQAANS